jgi:hypothetical protein
MGDLLTEKHLRAGRETLVLVFGYHDTPGTPASQRIPEEMLTHESMLRPSVFGERGWLKSATIVKVLLHGHGFISVLRRPDHRIEYERSSSCRSVA